MLIMMKTIVALLVLLLSFSTIRATEPSQTAPWSASYQNLLDSEVDMMSDELSKYPMLRYPNPEHEALFSYFPKGKVLLFGYGSLMNKSSAGGSSNAAGRPTIKPGSVNTMVPAIAFGVKRLFNYEDRKGYYNEFEKQRAYLNLARSDPHAVINGITLEVDQEDLKNLVKREVGYDLVPILVASWQDAAAENPLTQIQVAYTFMASSEPREGIIYTNRAIYPISFYARHVRLAAAAYGPVFLKMYEETTYFADGITKIAGRYSDFD